MLNSDTLGQVLKEIFGVEDQYIVPLDNGWYVPTYDPSNKVGTWIGYRILSKKPNVRTFTGSDKDGPTKIKSVKVTFRLSFIGRQAEDLCDQTLMWDDRLDVQAAFEKINTQINYTNRQTFSYPVKNSGLNTSLCWCVDMNAQTFYEISAGYKPWFLNKIDLGGKINV